MGSHESPTGSSRASITVIAVRWCRPRRSKPARKACREGSGGVKPKRGARGSPSSTPTMRPTRASSRPSCARSSSSCRRSCSIARAGARSPRAGPPATSAVTTRWRGGSSRWCATPEWRRRARGDRRRQPRGRARGARGRHARRAARRVCRLPRAVVGGRARTARRRRRRSSLISSPDSGCARWARSPSSPSPRCSAASGSRECRRTGSPAASPSAGSVPAALPPELVETIEFDPPAERVDEAAFAAKSLADRLLGRLDELGLSCTRVIVEAETEHGERLARCWRHDGALTPATLVDAGAVAARRLAHRGHRRASRCCVWCPTRSCPPPVANSGSGAVTPRPATTRRVRSHGCRGCSGPSRWSPRSPSADGRPPSGCAGCRGARTRSSVRARSRLPARRGSEPAAPWPGTVPGPSPARVFDPPHPADLLDSDGQAITVSGRGEPSAAPAALRCSALPNGGGPLVAWAGPWPHDLRWWDRGRLGAGTGSRLGAGTGSRRRRALWQVVVDGGGGTAVACLVAVSRGRAEIEAIYD